MMDRVAGLGIDGESVHVALFDELFVGFVARLVGIAIFEDRGDVLELLLHHI